MVAKRGTEDPWASPTVILAYGLSGVGAVSATAIPLYVIAGTTTSLDVNVSVTLAITLSLTNIGLAESYRRARRHVARLQRRNRELELQVQNLPRLRELQGTQDRMVERLTSENDRLLSENRELRERLPAVVDLTHPPGVREADDGQNRPRRESHDGLDPVSEPDSSDPSSE